MAGGGEPLPLVAAARPSHQPGFPYSQSVDSGLYFRGATDAAYRPKRAMFAFRFPLVAYTRRSGFSFWGRTPDSRGGRVSIQVRQGGAWRQVAVARTFADGIFSGRVKTSYGRNRHGWVRARCRGETAIPFSLHPVKDFYQPPFGRPVAAGK